jgi:two-component system LytT family response regulator
VAADDGPRLLLGLRAGVEVTGECANGLDAVLAIEADRPALGLLDIQMPEMDGFDAIRTVGADAMPAVVFVTAYDRHALRAFEVHALDYLLDAFAEPGQARRLEADTYAA